MLDTTWNFGELPSGDNYQQLAQTRHGLHVAESVAMHDAGASCMRDEERGRAVPDWQVLRLHKRVVPGFVG